MYPQLEIEEHQNSWLEAERNLAIISLNFTNWFNIEQNEPIREEETQEPISPSLEKKVNPLPKK